MSGRTTEKSPWQGRKWRLPRTVNGNRPRERRVRLEVEELETRALLSASSDEGLRARLGITDDELSLWRDTCITTALVTGPPALLGQIAELVG